VNLWSEKSEAEGKTAASQALDWRKQPKNQISDDAERLYLTNTAQRRTAVKPTRNDGIRRLRDRMEVATSLSTSEQQRTRWRKVQQTEQSWARDSLEPLMQKRKTWIRATHRS